MKVLTITLLAGALASASLQAQAPQTDGGYKHSARHDGSDQEHYGRRGHAGPPSAERMVERLSQELDLSTEQAGDLLTVLKDAELDRQALRAESIEEKMPDICALQADTDSRIRSILNEEQYGEMQSMKQERQARFEERGRGRAGQRPDCSAYQG